MSRPDNGELIDVWRVSPNRQGEQDVIVFDDLEEAVSYARDVLTNVFERLGVYEIQQMVIERSRMLRSNYDGLEDDNDAT